MSAAAPRFATSVGSLAATAAARLATINPAQAFPAAWAEVWQASGGTISHVGADICVFSPVGIDTVTVPANTDLHLYFNSADEQQGALNALHAILRRAGSKAVRTLLLGESEQIEADWALIREAFWHSKDLDADPVEAAHQRILKARPTSNRGAIIQLLTGLLHEHGTIPVGVDFEAAIVDEDYASLCQWEEAGRFDWGVRFAVRALCTLAGMEVARG